MIREPSSVFLVDDDAVQLLFLGAILRTAGHRVEDPTQEKYLDGVVINNEDSR